MSAKGLAMVGAWVYKVGGHGSDRSPRLVITDLDNSTVQQSTLSRMLFTISSIGEYYKDET